MLTLMQEREQWGIVAVQFGSPACLEGLAKACWPPIQQLPVPVPAARRANSVPWKSATWELLERWPLHWREHLRRSLTRMENRHDTKIHSNAARNIAKFGCFCGLLYNIQVTLGADSRNCDVYAQSMGSATGSDFLLSCCQVCICRDEIESKDRQS